MEGSNLKSLILSKQVNTALQIHTGKENPIVEEVQVERCGVTTTLLRAKVLYRCEDGGATHIKSYIIKKLPEWQSGETRSFEKESCFYGTVVPFCRRLAEGKVTLPMPESDYSIANGSEDAVYVDDLSIRGYRTVEKRSRMNGVDLHHCQVAMDTLGRLHGLASASQRLLPDGGWHILVPPLHRDEHKPGAFDSAMETAVDLAKQIDGLPEQAAEKALKAAWKAMCRFVGYGPKVLCHGNFWVNNVMYRYDKRGTPLEAKVIDFQTTRYAHPCSDILHFLHCSTKKSLRDEHVDELLESYHASLAKTMHLTAVEPFISLEQLKDDARGPWKVYGAVMGALLRPVFMLDADDLLQRGNSAAVKRKFAEDEHYRDAMTEIVRELVEVAMEIEDRD